MRLFTAVKLSANMEKVLLSAQNQLCSRQVQGNYTDCHNLHLIGIYRGIRPSKNCPYSVAAGDIGTIFTVPDGEYGNFGRFALGSMEKNTQLTALSLQVRQQLAVSHIPYDKKPFQPHITLLRKAVYHSDVNTGDFALPKESMTVTKISLMHSHRQNGQLIYTEIGSVKANLT